MLVRKLRLDRGWSQEVLAEISGVSVRTIQRIERGGNASLETLGALAAAFDVDIATLSQETRMYRQRDLSDLEQDALEHVRDIKGFYNHLIVYLISIAAMAGFNLFSGGYLWFLWPALGWGLGVAAHGLSVFEVFSLFSPNWEKRQVEKRLERRSRPD